MAHRRHVRHSHQMLQVKNLCSNIIIIVIIINN